MTDVKFLFEARYRVVWLALVLLLLVAVVTEQKVFSRPSVELVTALAGVLALAAAGQLIVVMSGGIDLSVPSVMVLGGAIIVKQTNAADDHLLIAVIEAVVAGGIVGLVNGLLVAVARLNAFIVTLAMNGIVAGVILLWTSEGAFSTSGKVPHNLAHLAHSGVGPVSVIGLIGLGVLLVLALLFRSTDPGRRFIAMGTNRVGAEIIGVRVRLYEVSGYVLAALLYVAAGVLLSGFVTSPNTSIGEPYLLTTIVAVALGGAALGGGPSSLLCTGAACVFLALLDQYLSLKNFSSGVTYLANGLALALAVAIVTVGSGGRLRLRALANRLRLVTTD
jgi:ribose transport system permease protein